MCAPGHALNVAVGVLLLPQILGTNIELPPRPGDLPMQVRHNTHAVSMATYVTGQGAT